jgi:hypothetical protein
MRGLTTVRFTARVPIVVAALALGIATAELSGCGSGSASSAASSAAKAVTGAASSATSELASKTQSASETAETQTVTKPAATASVTKSTSVNAQVTHTTPAATDSGGGPSWWVWVLIALGAVGVLIAVFMTGRRRGKSTGASSPPAPDEPELPSESTPTATQ